MIIRHLACSVFSSLVDPEPQEWTPTFAELLVTFRTPAPRDAIKENLPLWAPATFHGARARASVVSASLLGYDVDELPEANASDLADIPFAGLFHSTSSYRCNPPKPGKAPQSWRLFILLSRDVTAAEYDRLWPMFRSTLTFGVGASRDPSRQWFVPHEPQTPHAYVFHELTGEPLDVDQWLRAAPETPVQTSINVSPSDPRISGAAFAPTPIATTHADFPRRCALAATEIAGAPARGIGDRSTLWALALFCVRRLELPLEICTSLLAGYGAANDWTPVDLQRKLIEARDKSDMPCGIFSAAQLADIATAMRPVALRETADTPAPQGKRRGYVHTPGDEPSAHREGTSMSELIRVLTRHDEWHGVWKYNTFANAIEAHDPPLPLSAEEGLLNTADVTGVRTWLEAHGLQAGPLDIRAAIEVAAHQNRYHPVVDYLRALPSCPDPAAVLDGLAARVLGGTGEMDDAFLRKTLIGAVRRVLAPGTKVDTMLVLYGQQGARKSTFVKELFGRSWSTDSMPDLKGRDASIQLEGHWCVEFSEVDILLKTHEKQVVKGFLSREDDRFRDVGVRDKCRRPRQTVFVGTTNEDTFLDDSTGNRRYWPIHVGERIDLEYLRAHRDEIWAAALACADADEPHFLDPIGERSARSARKSYEVEDPWHETVADYCRGQETVRAEEIFRRRIAAGDEGALAKWDRKAQARLTSTLQRLGCIPGTYGPSRGRFRGWFVPEALRAEEPSLNEKMLRGVTAATHKISGAAP